MSEEKNDSDYGLGGAESKAEITLPEINYQPSWPDNYNPSIGLIGAGGITASHLSNYKTMGLNVVAIADINEANAKDKQEKYYPDAKTYLDYHDIINDPSIEVVDVATHVNIRPGIVREALNAGKHVLSQKPFVTNIEEGLELIELAKSKDLKLAVNQNGRWAPHFSYLRKAAAAGLVGEINSINCVSHFDHTWTKGTPFEEMKHMILYDFSIHWFDIVNCIMQGAKPLRVFSSLSRFEEQVYKPDSIASVLIEYPNAQVCMQFHAHVVAGQCDITTVNGAHGTMKSQGSGLNDQPEIQVFTNEGQATCPLEGAWFNSGFQGTMGELLNAIAEDREPENSAASNITSLELAFSAIRSADTGQPVDFGTVKELKQ